MGEEKKAFHIYRKVVCQVVVFNRMFDTQFREVSSGRAHFPKDSPLPFTWLVEWIYWQDTEIMSESDGIVQRIKLYYLASKYGIYLLTDQLMDCIIKSVKKRTKFLDRSAMDYVYRDCDGKCGLKRFITACFVFTLLGFVHEGGALEDSDDDGLSSDVLMKLTRDKKELHLAVFQYLGEIGDCMIAPYDESPHEWHEGHGF